MLRLLQKVCVGGRWHCDSLPAGLPAPALVHLVCSALSSQRDPVKTLACAPRVSLLCSELSLNSPVLSEKESLDPSGPQGPMGSSLRLLLCSLPATLACSLLLESSRKDLVSVVSAFACVISPAWTAPSRWPQASPPPPLELYPNAAFSGRSPWPPHLECQHPALLVLLPDGFIPEHLFSLGLPL